MKTATFHKISYMIMAVLTLMTLVAVTAVSVSSDTQLLKGPLMIGIFAVYVVLQFVCLFFTKPQISAYKIGFYLMHVGVPLMLIGFMLYELFGMSLYANVPVDSRGNVYPAITKEDGSVQQLGFGIRLNNFTVENYENGGPKYYGAYLGIYDYNEKGNTESSMYNSENITLEVNKTYRKEGFKIYLMSYDDGSAYLPENEVFETVQSVGGASAVVAQMTASGKYKDAEVYYFRYDPSKGAYTSVGSDVTKLADIGGNCKASIYKGSDGRYYAYFSQTYVQLLFKKDPGEYAVLFGMVLSIVGVLLMCVISKIKLPFLKNAEDEAAKSRKSAEVKK